MGIKVALTGEIRSGKDTVADYIREQCGSKLQKLYFAEGIENIIRTYFPEAYEGNEKPRQHFQDVGTKMREVNPDVWVNRVASQYALLVEKIGSEDFICTDLRQPNEYEWLKENGFTVIKVETASEIRVERMKASGDKFDAQSLIHPVELQIRNLPCDYIITNNTTLDDLFAQVDYVLDELKGGF